MTTYKSGLRDLADQIDKVARNHFCFSQVIEPVRVLIGYINAIARIEEINYAEADAVLAKRRKQVDVDTKLVEDAIDISKEYFEEIYSAAKRPPLKKTPDRERQRAAAPSHAEQRPQAATPAILVDRRAAAKMLGDLSIATVIRMENEGALTPIKLRKKASSKTFYKHAELCALANDVTGGPSE